MSVFIVTRNVTSPAQIAPHFAGIASMLPGSFNEGATCRFLTALILNLPPATAHSLKAVALARMLPILYACVSAYHSVDPFSTFVEDGLVLEVFSAADLIAQAEFAGDARYAEIFVKFLSDNAKYLTAHPPDTLVDELSAELWRSDAADLAALGRFYGEMCRGEIAAVNAAIYAVVDAFLRKSPDKPGTASHFAEVLVCAAGTRSPFAKNLLRSFASLSGAVFGGPGALMPVPDVVPKGLATIAAAVRRDVGSNQMALVAEGDIAVREAACALPLIPLVGEVARTCEEERRALRRVRLQPFHHQIEFWQAVQKQKPAAVAGDGARPTAFDFFAHAEARGLAARGAVALGNDLLFPPESFILRDEELADFEARIR
jgi:hypothetical protein